MIDLDAVDEQLAAWEQRLSRIDENLLALEGDATYQLLAGGVRATLEGVSGERIVPAIDAMQRLFENRERLRSILDRAHSIRASIGTFTFSKDEKIEEIVALLTGPSISIGAQPKPIEQRNLLDPAVADVSVVPDQLVRGMIEAYELARDAVAAVKSAWAKLEPAIEEIEREATTVTSRAASAGDAGIRNELDEVRTELADLRRRVANDPLGTDRGALDRVRDRVRACAKKVEEWVGAADRARSLRARASEVRRRLDEVRADAERARAELARSFADAPTSFAKVDRATLIAMDEWLTKLDRTASDNARRAEIGLARWIEEAESHVNAEHAAVHARDRFVARKAELAGRLGARKAQVASLRARGAVGADVEALVRRAEESLAGERIALAAAVEAIDALDRAVTNRSR